MIWLTWRQARTPALVAASAAALLLALLLLTGPRLADAYSLDGLADCVAGHEATGDRTCGDIERTFLGTYSPIRGLLGLTLLGLPLVAGVFLGAPLLAREYEAGTHRLAWTQGVSRTRWLATKLALVGGATLAVTAVLSAVFTWWSGPSDRLGSRLTPDVFAQRGLVPVAHVALALALGVLVGAIVRRTLPAMAVTLLLFLGVRTAVQAEVRPRLLDPVEISFPTFSFYADEPADQLVADSGWIVGTPRTVDAQGVVVGEGYPVADAVFASVCRTGNAQPSKAQLDACGQELGLHDVVEVHPADRFWALQLRESAFYAAATAALVAAAFLRVRRPGG